MRNSDESKVGAANAKVPDTQIQGLKAGRQNRAHTDAGAIPPPAGEVRPQAEDPRRQVNSKPEKA